MSVMNGCNGDHDERSLRVRLARAERLLRLNELLVAGLIHDLRTPLMAINLSAEVALQRSESDAVQQATRRIRSSSERMARIFDHLLNLSRLGAPVPDLDLKRGDLRAVVDAALAEWRSAEPDAVFDVTADGDLVGVFDDGLVRRSVANLVATAFEHAGATRTVTIHLDGSHRDRLWVRVCAAGVIPADVQERMFKPGRIVAGLETSGLGLGLDAIDGFVRAHGGSVLGRSKDPGGTAFELLLPRDAMLAS